MAVVLVTDAETRAALAAVRSLGRAGHTVHVAGHRLPCVASASRYVAGRVAVPSPRTNPADFVRALERHVDGNEVAVVLPVTDAATSAILHYRGNSLGRAVVAAADRDSYDRVSDKAALIACARETGIPVPPSVIVSDPSRLTAAVREIGIPCVVKPHRSVVLIDGVMHTWGVCRVVTERDPPAPYPDAAFPVVVQQWVPGHGEGVFVLMDRGRLVASFAHRRIREKPPSGGVSVYREAIAPQKDLLLSSQALLGSLGWHGAAMVEFRRTTVRTDSGRAYLMEVNGRLWGSLQLAIDAGVDFPGLVVDLALGRPVSPVTSYRIGGRSRWFWGDVDHLIARLRRSRTELGLGPDAPSRLGALWEFLRIRGGDKCEVFDLRDPRPFLRESLEWFSRRD